MALIDQPRAEAIYEAMGPAVEISGGSAANTIVGVASLGGRGAFVGKVKDDEFGRTFAHDIRAAGVAFNTPPASDGPATARCYILVTPDGERTMNTYLGAAQDLHPNDIDPDAIAAAEITYLEGYLWDPPHAKEAFLKAAKIAHGAGRRVALTLSDAFCVDRYRAEFLDLIRNGTVDIVFANERELHSLYQTADFDTAVNAMRNDAKLAAITRSEKGCLVDHARAERRGAGGADRKDRRCDRRRRPVRRRVPGRPRARRRPPQLCPAWGAGGGGSDPAHGRAAGNVAEGAGRERPDFRCKRLRSRRFRQAVHTNPQETGRVRRGVAERSRLAGITDLWGVRIPQEGSHEFVYRAFVWPCVCQAASRSVPDSSSRARAAVSICAILSSRMAVRSFCRPRRRRGRVPAAVGRRRAGGRK